MSLSSLSNIYPFYPMPAGAIQPWQAIAKIKTLEDCVGPIFNTPPFPTQNYKKIECINILKFDPANQKIATLANLKKVAIPNIRNLEEQFSAQCFPHNMCWFEDFDDFLVPNEHGVKAVHKHLVKAFSQVQEPCYLLVTGSFRTLFDALLAPKSQCKGVIGRDINPKIKAVIDFELLLVRIAKNRKEFSLLSQPTENIDSLKAIILEKLAALPDLTPNIKTYYRQNLDDFMDIYFNLPNWKLESSIEESFKGADYFFDENLFTRLQNMVNSGNIIATVGNINDLDPFKRLPIAAIDISNIYNYATLDFKWPRPISVIWTKLTYPKTTYFSHNLTPVSEETRSNLKNLLNELAYVEDIPCDGEYRTPHWFKNAPPFFCAELLWALQSP